ncbi:MAG: hypothetical protein A2Z12_08865 [Actinobacteria bacterium RBG_16_68_21]|nr:MAG: hypothetical protein A2Z12_08865 [Actinobacteria bacterium RBG_16_68_21]
MNDSLPVVPYRRVLVPGTRASVPARRDDVAAGDRIVVVLEQADGTRGAVGTTAEVRGVHAPDFGGWMLDVAGEALVVVLGAGDRAEVVPVDRPGDEAADLVGEVRSRLRRYMAARSEAGQGGDIHIDIGPDPVKASHEVASHLRISWPEIQAIFEAGDATARLRLEAKVLDRETTLLRALLGRKTD